jgi:hypothetical protein
MVAVIEVPSRLALDQPAVFWKSPGRQQPMAAPSPYSFCIQLAVAGVAGFFV